MKNIHDLKKSQENISFFAGNFFHIMLPVFILLFISFLILSGVVIPLLRERHLQYKKELCRTLVEAAVSALESRNSEVVAGLITREAAVKRASERLRSFRFGDGKKDYYFIIGPGTRIIMHPYRPDLENVDLEKISWGGDENIKSLFGRMRKIAYENGSGYVTYKWQWKDDQSRMEEKLSYVQLFRPWGWTVGTGVYLNDIDEELSNWKNTLTIAVLIMTGISGLIAFFLSFKTMRLKERENQALENLRLNEEKFRSVFNYSPFGIAVNLLKNEKFVAVNQAFTELIGVPESKILSFTFKEAGIEQALKNELDLNKLKTEGNILNREIKIELPGGDSKTLLYSAALISYDGQDAVLSMVVDVTQERQMEETLMQAQKLDVIGQLTGGIAHDFNNMLAGIMGGAELLKIQIGDEPSLQKKVDIIIEGTRRASDLTQKLLTFARKKNIVRKRVDIHDSVREAVTLLERSIDRRINIRINLNASLSCVSGDATLLQNIFLNLGLNARDAMNDGGTLTFSTADILLDEKFCLEQTRYIHPGQYIEIDVRDTGSGMSDETIRKIFEPFFTTKPVGMGTGLGMSVVYGTVKEHGGAVNVYSEVGKGTLVKIFIPVSLKEDKVEEKSNEEPVCGTGRILLIDDEELVRSIAKSLLESLGYYVDSACDGEEGVEMFREKVEDYDLILMDIVMPRLSGVEAFEIMKGIKPGVRVLFSSGFNREQSIQKLMDEGAAGFIQKPYEYIPLSRAVADAMGKNKD